MTRKNKPDPNQPTFFAQLIPEDDPDTAPIVVIAPAIGQRDPEALRALIEEHDGVLCAREAAESAAEAATQAHHSSVRTEKVVVIPR